MQSRVSVPFVALVLLLGSSSGCFPAQREPESFTRLVCRPDTLYRGDTLTITLPAKPAGDELGVQTEDIRLYLISFVPGKADKIGPAIPPAELHRSSEVKLSMAGTKGSLAAKYSGGKSPRVTGPAVPIFRKSGDYEILLSSALGTEDAEVQSCWVSYVDKPAPARRDK